MNRVGQRLPPACLLALALHGALLFRQLEPDRVALPTPLPVQRIAVSLGTRKVVSMPLPEVKEVQQSVTKKEVVPLVKPVARNRPRPPPSLKETPAEKQPAHESAAPSPQPDMENVTAQATPAAALVILRATPLYRINPPPKYPRQARRRGLEGVVLLEALIDISGRVADLKLFTSSGHPVLDRAALKTVRRWRFSPGTIGGNWREMWVKVPIRYQLQ